MVWFGCCKLGNEEKAKTAVFCSCKMLSLGSLCEDIKQKGVRAWRWGLGGGGLAAGAWRPSVRLGAANGLRRQPDPRGPPQTHP